MTDLYNMTIEFIKVYPILFGLGILISALAIALITFIIVRKRSIRINKAKRIKNEIEKKRIEEEKLLEIKKAVLIAKNSQVTVDLEASPVFSNSTEISREEIKVKKQQLENEIKPTIQKVPESYKAVPTESINVKEPESIYKTNTTDTKDTVTASVNERKPKKIGNLPEAKKEVNLETTDNLYVNYQSTISESTDNYPVFRIPRKGCIIRTHRFGKKKRRGYKEESFQNSIQKFFSSQFIISGEVRLNTGKETRPFEPDIAIIDKKKEKNIRIDVEIDEPYAGTSRQPTHCKGDDIMRDTYFIDRGWIVIRFSEYQVHTQEIECLSFIAGIIKSLDSDYVIPVELSTIKNISIEKLWDVLQAQKWEKAKYREGYLKHSFQQLLEEPETIERDFNEQEINEEKLVISSIIGPIDEGKNIGYNKINHHLRDKRIVFYPEPHVYTIDNTPAPSASTVIGKFFPEFDAPLWSRKKAIERLQFSNEELTESNIRRIADQIAEEWKTKGEKAAQEGTFLHEQIENYYLGQPYQKTEEFHLFEQFVSSHNSLKPYRTEWRVFDEDYHIAGTIDLIVKNGDGYEIYDWKRSKKVVNKFNGEPIRLNQWQQGVGMLNDIDDTSFNRYCLQQSLYRYILEKKYGLRISRMYLIVLYPEYDQFYKVETPYLLDKIEHILKTL